MPFRPLPIASLKLIRKCVFLFLLFIPILSLAASDESMVTLDISPKSVKVGDIITLNIFIKHKPGYSLYLPDSIDLSPFDIIDTEVKALKKEAGTFSLATFKIAIYEVGIFSIPNINLLLKSDNDRIEIKTPQRKLEVLSTLKTGENALLDIYPPLNIKQNYMKFLLYVWGISLILIVWAILHFRKKKRTKKVVAIKPRPKVDPTKAALSLLNKIFDSINISALNDKEICENIAFTVKYFIKEKFEIDALEMTTRELIDCLDGLGANDDYLKILYKLLLACDLVKFANRPLYRDPKNDEVAKLKNDALSIIKAA